MASLCCKCAMPCKQEVGVVMACRDYVKYKKPAPVNTLEQKSVASGIRVVRIPAQYRDTAQETT